MLIILENTVINLDNTISFCLDIDKQIIRFYFNFMDEFRESYEECFSFTKEESSKKAFDRIIYAYANEFKTLDLTEYE